MKKSKEINYPKKIISKKILKKGNEEFQIINNINVNFRNSNQNLDIFIFYKFYKQNKLDYKINDFIIKPSIKEILNSNIENIKKQFSIFKIIK